MRRYPRLVKRTALGAGALAVVLLSLWGAAVSLKDTPMGGENGQKTAFVPARTQGAEALKLGDSGALARMAREIQSQLDDLGLRSAINRTPFRFTLRKRGDLSNDVLKRVQFLLLDPAGGERRVLGSEPQKDGKPVVDALEFEIPDAPEGDYLLRAVLHEGQFPKGAPVDRPFRVDLTGPSFELGAVSREELIALDPEWFVTYNEETELQLSTPLNPGDIQSAYYQIYADSLKRFGGDKQKIADASRWRVTLVPGQNRFQVVAADDLGNESARVVRIDRLKLEVVKFEIDRMAGGVVGNRAAVRGELILERLPGPPGDGEKRVPALAYLVNERLVVPEEFAEPTAESPVFKARLFLPRHTNTIELRYQWGDDSLRRFAVANAARLAQEVPAPRVDLAPLPAQTSKTSLEVAGRVSPYFDGLEVHLLHEPMGSYRLPLRPALGAAEFSEVRHLLENKVNRFTVTCTYEGQALAPGGPSVEVYCDINPPRLLDPVEFRPKGEFLQVVVVPSEEPLLSLQMKTPDGEWRQIASRNDGRYGALVPMPMEKTEFLFKMVDLAGNENVVKQVCPVFDPSLLTGGPEIQGRTAGTGREEDGRLVRSSHRLIQRSEMLKKLELEFLSCVGLAGEEMGTTEVNQKAWNAFLRDRLGQKVPEGDPRLPMTIGERFDPSYLHFFALWLTEKSDDGYQYRVPTANQWILAFTGSREVKEASENLKRWFKGPQRRFNPSPRKRYGVNEVLPIGERPENRTPTGLLDMESNVQEIVTDENGFWHVIGGYNLFRGEDDLLYGCSEKRLYSTATENWAGKFTGFRLLRKPQKPE